MLINLMFVNLDQRNIFIVINFVDLTAPVNI